MILLALLYQQHQQSCTHSLNHFGHCIRASSSILLYITSLFNNCFFLRLCRLWHQLTKKLFEFFDHPQARPFRVDVFERFVRDFESKINQLRLAEMAVMVAKDIDSMCDYILRA